MTWRCSSCGETHDDAFRSCWSCGKARPLSTAELADEERELKEEAVEDANAEAESRRQDAVATYQREAGWYRPPQGDRAAETGMSLHRLVTAYRLYRQRQEAGIRRSRPDLDRLWTHFFLASAVLGGLVLSTATGASWLAYLASNEVLFVAVYGGALVLCVTTGRRVVARELKAAAEAAVAEGGRGDRRVT